MVDAARDRRQASGGRAREAARNDQVVDTAARQLVAERGAAVPMSEIAARAGVGVATVYRRYPTKADLLARLGDRAARELEEAVAVALSTPDPVHAMRRLTQRLAEAGIGSFLGLLTATPAGRAAVAAATGGIDEVVGRGRAIGAVRQEVTGSDLVALASAFGAVPVPGRQRLLTFAVDGLLTANRRTAPGDPVPWDTLLAPA